MDLYSLSESRKLHACGNQARMRACVQGETRFPLSFGLVVNKFQPTEWEPSGNLWEPLGTFRNLWEPLGPSFTSFHGIFISSSFAASHNSSFEQNCVYCSWSQSVSNLLSVSIVRSFMCLSAFPCTFTSCSSSRMHALCPAVTTSFCPRHPAL